VLLGKARGKGLGELVSLVLVLNDEGVKELHRKRHKEENNKQTNKERNRKIREATQKARGVTNT